jgi:hypothetical protein
VIAVLLSGVAVPRRLAVGGPPIDGDVRAHIAAELDAGVGAGNVEEARAIEGADLHVFDRLGLDRKVGRLRGDRDRKNGRRAEDEGTNRFHVDLPSPKACTCICRFLAPKA